MMSRYPWLGAWVAAVVAFALTLIGGQATSGSGLLGAALSFSALTVLAALGQVLVI